MKRWLHSLLRIENNMSPFSIKHHTSWNESESFEPQFTVFFTYKITASWVGTSKFGRINCIELTGNWESNISIFSHEEPPYYCRNSKSNTCTFWVPLMWIDLRTRTSSQSKMEIYPLMWFLTSYSPYSLFLTFRSIWVFRKWPQMISHAQQQWW